MESGDMAPRILIPLIEGALRPGAFHQSTLDRMLGEPHSLNQE
jgi:hypothetical protein